MHSLVRKLLPSAVGHSEFVFAINADVRGFSEFSTKVESAESAVYIKHVYVALLSQFFNDATFFRLSGDGLLIVVSFDEQNLEPVANRVVESCLQAVEAFPTICRDIPIINFPVPDKIGIGIARGTACRLASGRRILDYSGSVLNQASRLMELARPKGLVIHSNIGFDLLKAETARLFESSQVYLRGVSESRSHVVYSQKCVLIPESARHLPGSTQWVEVHLEPTLAEMAEMGETHYELEAVPSDPQAIFVELECYAKGNGRSKIIRLPVAYMSEAGKPTLLLEMPRYVDELAKNKVSGARSKVPMTVRFEAENPKMDVHV